MYYADRSGKNRLNDLFADALAELSKKESPMKPLLALEDHEFPLQVMDGHQRVTQSYWGEVHRRVYFAARELTIARFHFQVIDFSDSMPLQEALMRISQWGYWGCLEESMCAFTPRGGYVLGRIRTP